MNVFVRIYGNSFAVFNRHYDIDEIFEKRKGCPIKGILSDHIRKNGQDFFSFESAPFGGDSRGIRFGVWRVRRNAPCDKDDREQPAFRKAETLRRYAQIPRFSRRVTAGVEKEFIRGQV